MSTVRHLLGEKGKEIWSVAPKDMVLDALKIMAEKNVGALLVLDKDKLAGIFSERDYARKIVLEGKESKDTPVEEFMTREVFCIAPNRSTEECMALMTDKHIRHLPVMENDKILGIITIGDVVKAVIAHKNFMIRDLENFIAGTGYGA